MRSNRQYSNYVGVLATTFILGCSGQKQNSREGTTEDEPGKLSADGTDEKSNEAAQPAVLAGAYLNITYNQPANDRVEVLVSVVRDGKRILPEFEWDRTLSIRWELYMANGYQVPNAPNTIANAEADFRWMIGGDPAAIVGHVVPLLIVSVAGKAKTVVIGTNRANGVLDSGPVVPPGFIKVNARDGSVFWVMKYEAKMINYKPASHYTIEPWVNITRDNARARCAELGPEYSLISNAQWQVIAQSIELTPENWKGVNGTANAINRGHSDKSAFSLAASTDDNPCAGTDNQNCTLRTHADFTQKRTHALSNGEVIWDLAGNVSEWVNDDNATTASSDLAPNNMSQVRGLPKTNWGPFNDYYSLSSAEVGGFGYAWLQAKNSGNGAVFRGGNSQSLITAGIFAVWLTKAPSASTDDIGFRCVWVPTSL